MGKCGAFNLDGVALEDWFLWGVEVPVPVPGLDMAGYGPSLLLHLGFVPHGDVLTLFL